MGALAIGMTSVTIASEDHESASKDKQLCFQINGDINNSTHIDKIYLTVNSAGMATGNECFYSSATPSCSPANNRGRTTISSNKKNKNINVVRPLLIAQLRLCCP